MIIFSFFSFLIGSFFGYLLQKSNFCIVGAIRETFKKRFTLIQLYLASALVCLILTQSFLLFFPIDISLQLNQHTIHYNHQSILIVLSIFGGVIFGLGAFLAGGCPSRQIIFLTRGNLESLFILLVMGYTGFLLQKNALLILNQLDINFFIKKTSTEISFNYIFSIPFYLKTTIILVAIIVLFFFSIKVLLLGIGMGITVSLGWIITIIAYQKSPEIPIQSFNFIAPFVKIFLRENLLKNFYLFAILGVFAGSFAFLFQHKSFQPLKIKTISLKQRLLGGSLMGLGIGCTIGQGIAGLALLSTKSFLAFSSSCLSIIFFILIKNKITSQNSQEGS